MVGRDASLPLVLSDWLIRKRGVDKPGHSHGDDEADERVPGPIDFGAEEHCPKMLGRCNAGQVLNAGKDEQ